MEWILSSCVLIIFIIAIRKIFRKKLDARVLYALWLLVAVRLLVPFSFLESPLSVQNFIREDVVFKPENLSVGEQMEDEVLGADFTGGNVEGIFMPDIDYAEGHDMVGDAIEESGSLIEAGDNKVLADSEASMPQAEENISWPDYDNMAEKPDGLPENMLQKAEKTFRAGTIYHVFFFIWLIGMAVSILIVLVANMQYRKVVRATRKQRECVDSKLPVYVSERVNTPCMFGIIHPAIYLTEDTLVQEKGLKYILCHENTHYKHRDNWWAVVRVLCVCVHWYNPFVWLAARYSKQDCELACDAETLEQLNADEKIDYGKVLLNYSISDRSLYDRLQLATSMSGGKKQLKERLQMIVRQPKCYVWALVVVVLLVGVGVGMTFTGRAADNEGDIPVSGMVEGEGIEAFQENEVSKGNEEPNVSDEPQVTTEPELSGQPDAEATAEPTVAPTEIPQGTLGGYMEYTGYMDECYRYSGYEGFVNQDYDEDGLTDRVWRDNVVYSAYASMCTYRIEFGNGDILQTGTICEGTPTVRAGDLDSDGVNEILISANYWTSSDPNSYGEWVVFKKQGDFYEIVRLPVVMADYEGNGNGGVLPAYQPHLNLNVEDVGDYKARIYTEDLIKPDEAESIPMLDVVIDFGEEDWKTIDMDGYLTKNRWDGPNYDEVLYYSEIVEEPVPFLRAYVSLFGKWCEDEIVISFVLKDGEFQIYSVEYIQKNTIRRSVDLGDDKVYQLEVGRAYMAGNDTQKINWIYLNRMVNNTAEFVCQVDLNEASAREWGEPQAIWGNEGYAIVVEDFNFDGCEDLAVQGWTGAKNIPYYCFLWNPVTRAYDYSALIPNVEVDKEKQLVISSTNDGGGQYSTTYYKYDDKNQLHMVRYVVENLSPEAALPKLDLFYYGDDTYALQAVEHYNEKTASYEGVCVGELTYYAKKALEELYEYSGYRVEQAYFTVYESGIVAFGQTLEDMQKNRHFYSRCFDELGPLAADISSMTLATEREVWYSPVIQWNVPELYEKMTDEELVQWFFRQAPIAGGEEINYMEENFEGNFLIETESGNWYEVGYNSEKRLVSSIYGPYPEYPTH